MFNYQLNIRLRRKGLAYKYLSIKREEKADFVWLWSFADLI